MRSSKLVRFHCEVKIFLGESTFIMGREAQSDFIPADINVWVVRCALGEPRNSVYKFDGGCKIAKLKRADDGRAFFSPFGQEMRCFLQRYVLNRSLCITPP